MTERLPITHVAVRFNGKVYSLPKPNRHHDVIRHIVETEGASHVESHGEDQGFLDSSGRYLNRKQALVSAQVNDQMRADRPIWHNELYSENLWLPRAIRFLWTPITRSTKNLLHISSTPIPTVTTTLSLFGAV